MFYVLLGLRAELRERGAFSQKSEPNLIELLDLVALGTVSDLVKLDANNRILVEQGLRRIRAGVCCEGIKALLKVAGRDFRQANAQDLGFYIGPRLNAAGRLDDMRLGIQCLLAEDLAEAQEIAQTLHEMNALRRNIETDMQEGALVSLDNMQVENQFSISLFEPSWHQGVVGILASRIKEKFHRPVIAFADAGEHILKGSGRSIAGLHLRDALDLVTKRNPNLILKFGGHAMAAGLSIKQEDFLAFQKEFELVVRGLINPADLMAIVETDGSLETSEMSLDVASMLTLSLWGQGFASPLFSDVFIVLNQRIVGEKHLKLNLEKDKERFDAIFFGQADFLPDRFQGLYQLQVNTYNRTKSLQLQILSALPA
jgi:single-stranded-DNA-specific exonuclease